MGSANVTTQSITGLFPNMTVSATAGGNPVFLAGTQITSVTANGFSVPAAANVLQAANNTPIAATNASPPKPYQSPGFARIYAFSFEGAIYGLPKPAIFLVHGPGLPVDVKQARGFHTTLDESGVIAREWEFASSAGNDILYWEYEKGDFSIRLDTEAGPFEQILLSAALRAGADMADRSGANLGVRSGANLSGANLSGANLSGANLSGANLRSR
jgi:hypothetical protein